MAEPIDQITINGEMRELQDAAARDSIKVQEQELKALQAKYNKLYDSLFDKDGNFKFQTDEETKNKLEQLISAGEESSVIIQKDDGTYEWPMKDLSRYEAYGYVLSSKGGSAGVTIYRDGEEYRSKAYIVISRSIDGSEFQYYGETAILGTYNWYVDTANTSFKIDCYKDSSLKDLLCSTVISPGRTGETGKQGQASYKVELSSTNGTVFKNGITNTQLQCAVFSGVEEITDTINSFVWKKYNANGEQEVGDKWPKYTDRNSLDLNADEVDKKNVFVCEVTLDGTIAYNSITLVDITDGGEYGRNLLLSEQKINVSQDDLDSHFYKTYSFDISDYGKETIKNDEELSLSFKVKLDGDVEIPLGGKEIEVLFNYSYIKDKNTMNKSHLIKTFKLDYENLISIKEEGFSIPKHKETITVQNPNGEEGTIIEQEVEYPIYSSYNIMLKMQVEKVNIDSLSDEQKDDTTYEPSLSIEEIKLEFGNTATPWVPATQDEVSTLNSALNDKLINLNTNLTGFFQSQGNASFITVRDAEDTDVLFNAIASSNYKIEPEKRYSKSGTAIDLINGNIYSQNFSIDDGNAYFRGNIEAEGIINATGGSIGGFYITEEEDGSPVLKNEDGMFKISNQGTTLPADSLFFSIKKIDENDNEIIQTVNPFQVRGKDGALIFNAISDKGNKVPSLMLKGDGLYLFDKELSTSVDIANLGNNEAVAYIEGDTLYVNKAQVVSRHIIADFDSNKGGYGFITRSNGHMALKWVSSAN